MSSQRFTSSSQTRFATQRNSALDVFFDVITHSTYTRGCTVQCFEHHNAKAGGDFRRLKDFECPEADRVNAELEKAKTLPAPPFSKRGKVVVRSTTLDDPER